MGDQGGSRTMTLGIGTRRLPYRTPIATRSRQAPVGAASTMNRWADQVC